MRILIVSSGLRPERFGGLPSHVEDLLETLVEAGQEVAYLNSGAKSKWPQTRAWKRENLPCPAWNLSSKLSYAQYWTGTRNPLAQIVPSRSYRRAFLKVIGEFRPQLIHFHELTSFPLELIEELRQRSIATVFSAADFYALCPTVKLFRPDHSFCTRSTEELDCDRCSIEARSEGALQLMHANDVWLADMIKMRNIGRRLIRLCERTFSRTAPTSVYVERRRHFEILFRKFDVVLATSRAQERIFRDRTSGWNVRFLQRSRKTIQARTPPQRKGPHDPDKLVFLALNIVNPAKGLTLLEEAFGAIHRDLPEVELHLYGLAEGAAPGICYHGPYDDSQLDGIIASADFGILPSIWPEAFGYVGPEMLSRGLPVVASDRGAMPDYVIHGMNGMLYDPSIPGALETCIRKLAQDASLRRRLWQGAAIGKRHYLTMAQHTEKLLEIYRDAISRASSSQNITQPT